MHHLGNFSLMAIIVLAVYAIAASLLGVRRGSSKLTKSAERALLACTAFSTAACFSLVWLLMKSDFRFEYVASYSNRDLPFFYKLASLWAGNDGSLLFWSWLMLVFSGIAVLTNQNKNRELMPYVVATLASAGLLFTYLNYFVTNPFVQLGVVTAAGTTEVWAPADGRGLNPLLQHPIMAIHPPILYIGYVGFVVPFAFCIAALASGRLGSEWITSTRRWTLVAWFFLGTGIILGGRWAYVELGWGGYWAWDPVENAALLPWLTGTAYLHSVIIQQRKGMLKIWNVALVVITYLLCVFGTFLTRSGVVSSVHAFAESDFAQIFLFFIFGAAVLCIGLILYRLPELKSENELDSLVSRESGFLFNNLLFLVACFAVLWGTMYPVLSEALQGEKAMVGPAWFNKVNIPLALGILLLTGVGAAPRVAEVVVGELEAELHVAGRPRRRHGRRPRSTRYPSPLRVDDVLAVDVRARDHRSRVPQRRHGAEIPQGRKLCKRPRRFDARQHPALRRLHRPLRDGAHLHRRRRARVRQPTSKPT